MCFIDSIKSSELGSSGRWSIFLARFHHHHRRRPSAILWPFRTDTNVRVVRFTSRFQVFRILPLPPRFLFHRFEVAICVIGPVYIFVSKSFASRVLSIVDSISARRRKRGRGKKESETRRRRISRVSRFVTYLFFPPFLFLSPFLLFSGNTKVRKRE